MYKKTIFILIIVSLGIGILRTLNNYSKFYTDKNTLIYQKENDLIYAYFNNGYILEQYFKNSKNITIYLVNADPLTFYYLRYKLFPSKVYRDSEKFFGNPKVPQSYDYYVSFYSPISTADVKKEYLEKLSRPNVLTENIFIYKKL